MSDTSHRLILVRHGRTALNAEGRLRGLADPPLDETGTTEARATARALAPLGLTHVLSSPLRRAVTTAKIIAEASGITADVDPAFNDRDYGPWTGEVKEDVIHQWGSIDNAPEVEDRRHVLARAQAALDALAHDQHGPIAVVTHDAVIRPLLENIRPGIALDVHTASWAELRHAGGHWEIISVDNTAPHGSNPSS